MDLNFYFNILFNGVYNQGNTSLDIDEFNK